MKVCSLCGDTYKDHVDFCFNDGEVLLLADAETATAAMLESDLDAPLPRRVQPQQQAGQGPNRATPAPAPTAGSATPILEPRVARPPNGEPVPSANLPVDGAPDSGEAGVEGVAAVAVVGGAQGTQPAHALSSHATVPPMESPVRTVTPSGPPPSAQPTLPPSPQSAVTPMLAEPREVMRVAPVPGSAPAAAASDTVTAPLVRPTPRSQAKTTPLAVPRASPIPGQRLGGQAATLPPEPATDRSNLLMVGAVFAFGVVVLPVAALIGLAYFVAVTGQWGAPNEPLTDKGSVAVIDPVPAAPSAVPAQVDPLSQPGSDDPAVDTEVGPDGVQIEPEPVVEPQPDGLVQIGDLQPEVEPPVPAQPQPARPRAQDVVFALTPEDAVVHMEDLRDGNGVPLTARVMDGSSFRMAPGETCTFVVTAPGYTQQKLKYPDEFGASLFRRVSLRAEQVVVAPEPPPPLVEAWVSVPITMEVAALTIDGKPSGSTSDKQRQPAGTHDCAVSSDAGVVLTTWKCTFVPGKRQTQ